MAPTVALRAAEILVIEENPANQDVFREAVAETSLRCRIHAAIDGREALEMLALGSADRDGLRPDLIFLDINLPRSDGREVLRTLRRWHSLDATPIVVFTSSLEEEQALREEGQGFDVYMTKPLRRLVFRDTIRELIQGLVPATQLIGSEAQRSRRQVVLIEDNDVHAELVASLLAGDSQVTYEITRFETLGAAIASPLLSEADAILLDLSLPDARGLTGLVHLSVQRNHAPIIVLSGQDDRHVVSNAIVIGAHDYLVKGDYTPSLLHRTIDNAIERKRLTDALVNAAMRDALTGLANRALFLDRLQSAMQRARRSRQGFALAYIDLDGFKPVNDRHGHKVGDALLVALAQRLNRAVRASDSIGRLGGDEFAVVFEGVETEDKAIRAAELLRTRLIEPYVIRVDGRDGPLVLTVGASIGVALAPEHAERVDGLVVAADVAMYAAKRAGKNRIHCYSAEDAVPAVAGGPLSAEPDSADSEPS